MRPFLKRSFSAVLLFLVALASPHSLCAQDATREVLPTTVFKNLQAGKKQTVVVYGTSLTIMGAWATGVGDYFNQQYPGLVTFVNGAKAGMTSDWGVANLQDRVLSKNPDLVFIEFSMNDAAIKNNVSLQKSEANLDNMVQALRKQNPQVDIILQTMNIPWDSPKTPTKKYGSERPNINGYYDVYRHYAQANHFPLVDNYPNWLKLKTENEANYEKMVSDGIHPHSIPSMEVTFPAVKALLEKARAAAAAAK